MSKKSGAEAHLDLLGKTVKCRVSNFEGVVTSISFDLYGCIQIAVNPPVDKDGKLPDGRWMDINRVDITDDKRKMAMPAFSSKPAEFGATPEAHTHGPAEKPTAGRRS